MKYCIIFYIFPIFFLFSDFFFDQFYVKLTFRRMGQI
jgi:hypothetical protein